MKIFRPLFGSISGIRWTRPTWLLVAGARAVVVPVSDHAVNYSAAGEPKAPRPAHEQYKWIYRIRPL